MQFQRSLPALLTAMLCTVPLFSQTYTDGPMRIEARVRDVEITLSANSDYTLNVGSFSLGAYQIDEYTLKFFGRDVPDLDLTGYTGGTCLTDEIDPLPGFTTDFSHTFFDHTYSSILVPKYLDINVDIHEDDLPTDFVSVSGSTACGTSGTRCTYETFICCQLTPFGGCLWDEHDDIRCNPSVFYDSLDYRLGPPCQWYSHGYLDGSCTNDFYNPRIETRWSIPGGDACSTAVYLGLLTPGFASFSRTYSTECSSNHFAGSPGNDFFYSFFTTAPMGITASLCGSVSWNSVLYVLDSNCTVIASSDDFCGSASETTVRLCTPGTYYIVVDGASAAEMGTYSLSLSNASVALPVAHAGPNVTICAGDTASIGTSPSGTGGTGGFTFSWSPGIWLADSTLGMTSAVVPSTTTFTLTATDSTGCAVTDDMTVIVSIPSIDLGPDDTLCAGTTLMAPGFSHWLWSTGDTTFSIAVAASGWYWLVGTNAFGCTAADSVYLDVITTPVSGFTYSETGGVFTFTNTACCDATAYQWTFGDGGTSSLENPTHIYAAPGTYTVCLIATNACGSDTSCQTILLTSLLNHSLPGELVIYPVPADDELIIEIPPAVQGEFQVRLYDMQGRICHAQNVMGGNASLQVSHLAPGVYQLVIRSAVSGVATYKVEIRRE